MNVPKPKQLYITKVTPQLRGDFVTLVEAPNFEVRVHFPSNYPSTSVVDNEFSLGLQSTN